MGCVALLLLLCFKTIFFGTLRCSLKGKGSSRNLWWSESPVTPVRPRGMLWNKVLLSHFSSPHSMPSTKKFHFASPLTHFCWTPFSILCCAVQEILAGGPVLLFAFHILNAENLHLWWNNTVNQLICFKNHLKMCFNLEIYQF